ncbi:hypothetical protein CPLU01_02486 [Colletotrichum plurivorum]|uniref:Uncharacterized protein n=1 Tax=Colletotrichum plurivorum TaxID=2175906 RepID=A0A8H6KVD3_9PEZI|nr:hypothetical protein CPLU01_02486 [Colletotrichum plurivorum]
MGWSERTTTSRDEEEENSPTGTGPPRILVQVLVVVVPAGAVPMLEYWNLSRTTHATTSLEPTVHPPWGVRPIEAQQQRQRSRSFDQRRHSKPRTSDHTADSGPAEIEQQMPRLETKEVQTHRRTLE